ncbi:unnamed protein product, partial [Oppiella nova]
KGLNRTDRIVLVNAYTDIEGIKVLDRTRQTNGTNRCLGAKCTHICLPTKLDYRCVCSKTTNFETRGDHNPHHYNCAIDWEYGSQ